MRLRERERERERETLRERERERERERTSLTRLYVQYCRPALFLPFLVELQHGLHGMFVNLWLSAHYMR